jgi:hypothetical protein
MNKRSSGFDDDRDVMIVAVAEPEEGHRWPERWRRRLPTTASQDTLMSVLAGFD